MLEILTNVTVVLTTISATIIWIPIFIPKYMDNKLWCLFITVLSVLTTIGYALRVVYTDSLFAPFGMFIWLSITISYFVQAIWKFEE
jgi:hypothetical protein